MDKNNYSLTELAKEIHAGNAARGFWDDVEEIPGEYFVAQKLALIHSEVSEALEALRKDEWSTPPRSLSSIEYLSPEVFTVNVKGTVEDELADVIIRCLDLAGGLGIDIDWHIQAKLKYNASRPYKHGKKF